MAEVTLRTVKTGELQIRATVVASSLNEQERTVDVCFATDSPILMGYWERYYEILSFEDGACDLTRLNSGAPMLDNHDRWGGASEQPGVVERAWVKDGKGYATLRFANDKSTVAGVDNGPGEKIFQRVKDKIVRSVSVGYTVQEYEEIESAGTQTEGMASDNKIPTYKARKWQPFEISFAPVPADIGAGVRSNERSGNDQHKSYEVQLFSNQNNTEEMKRRFLYETGAPGGGGGGEQNREQVVTPAPVAAPAAAAPAPAPTRAAEEPAPGESRERQIMDICEIAGLGLKETRAFIDSNKTLAQVRTELIAAKADGGTPVQHGNNRQVTVNDENRKARNKAMENAVIMRAVPGTSFKFTADEQRDAREFRGLDLMDMARTIVEEVAQGHTRGKSRREIAEAALNCGQGRSGMMSTSDLPNILGNVINRVLLNAYESQPSDWRLFSKQVSFKDFRQKTVVRMSEGQDLNLVKEGGEYERMTVSDNKEVYQVFKYGRIIPITWETFVNDDLDALGRIPATFAEMGARKQADLVYGQITGNPVMGDGVTLFHATHNNLLTGAAINIDSMGLMRKAMRNQKGIAGKQRLNLTPKYMLVGPNYEQLALQYTSADFVPTAQSGTNPWKGIYTPIVEARIEDNSWYGIVDPNRIDTLHYGFLEGEGELFTTQREGFDVDGLEVKARMVFGCKTIEYRAFAKNPGA